MVKAVYNNKQNKFICKQCKYPFNIFGVVVCKRTSNTFRELITRNSTISRGMNCSLAKYGKEEVSRGGVVASSLLIAAFKWANDIKNLVHFVSYIQQMTASKWSVHNSLTLLNFFGTSPVSIPSPALGDLYVVHSNLRICAALNKNDF